MKFDRLKVAFTCFYVAIGLSFLGAIISLFPFNIFGMKVAGLLFAGALLLAISGSILLILDAKLKFGKYSIKRNKPKEERNGKSP